MSCILYYSNFCDHSKKILQNLSKSQMSKDIHFICIDKRIKQGDKIYLILENGQKIVLPENVSKVPALLLLNENYRVLYGETILQHFKPSQEVAVKQATFNNIEPMAFSFSIGGGGAGGSNYGIASDQYSFLDMDAEDLTAKGNGGVRQMHNYVNLQYNEKIYTPENEENNKASKMPDGINIEQLQKQREQELGQLGMNNMKM